MARATRMLAALALCIHSSAGARVDRVVNEAEATLAVDVDADESLVVDATNDDASGADKIAPLIEATRRVDQKLEKGDLMFSDFLDFSNAFEETLGALGTAFKLGKRDFSNNINKMTTARKKLERSAGLSANPTCKEFLQAEKGTGIHKKGGNLNHDSGADGMLWIRRSCQWVLDIMSELVAGKPELYDAAKAGYENQLEVYHGWMLRKVFGGVIWNLPTKESFCRNLLDDQQSSVKALDATCKKQMHELTVVAAPMMDYLVGVFKELDLEDYRKI